MCVCLEGRGELWLDEMNELFKWPFISGDYEIIGTIEIMMKMMTD